MMVKDVALITISCVLFVQMGLSEAIQDAVKFKSKILSCPRCLTFWSVFAWSLWHCNQIIESVATSFLSSYSALWIALLYDSLATLYNKAYDKISSQHDTDKADANEVSEL